MSELLLRESVQTFSLCFFCPSESERVESSGSSRRASERSLARLRRSARAAGQVRSGKGPFLETEKRKKQGEVMNTYSSSNVFKRFCSDNSSYLSIIFPNTIFQIPCCQSTLCEDLLAFRREIMTHVGTKNKEGGEEPGT